MTFPYIGKNKHGVKALIYNHKTAMILNGDYAGQVHDMSVVDNGWFERKYENITADYLCNTKVKIESEEHSRFVIKLFNNAFSTEASSMNPKWVYNEGLRGVSQRFHGEPSKELKLITLPLPPKEVITKSQLPGANAETAMPKVKPPKEEVMSEPKYIKFMKDGVMTHMAEIRVRDEIQIINQSKSATVKYNEGSDSYSIVDLPTVSVNDIQVNVKNNTDSVVQVTKSDDEKNIFIHVNDLPKESEEPKTKEWPAVGDEVLTMPNEKAVVKAVDGGLAWIKYDREDLGYATEYVKSLKKPPAPEEELADILTEITGYQNRQAVLGGAKAIMNGEIKGLSYKHE